jgi:hypothetical protein
MADLDFDDFDAGYGAPMGRSLRVSRIVTIAGGVSSVVLLVGLGIWGYDQAVRHVNGVPVIRAMEGPMRIAPENPGGEVADHQGLSVNAVAAAGIAAPPPERLVLAPRPVELTDEDVAGLAGASVAAGARAPQPADSLATPLAVSAAVPVSGATTVSAPPPVAASAPLTAPDPQNGAVEMALAEALSGDGGNPEEQLPGAEDVAALAPDSGMARPRARPDQSGAAPAVRELDPATLAEGTRLVQLGAFDTADEARAEWARLLNANPDLLSGKALVIQSASSGGRDFFRLRAEGFANEDEARSLCSALLGRDATCIPVLHR